LSRRWLTILASVAKTVRLCNVSQTDSLSCVLFQTTQPEKYSCFPLPVPPPLVAYIRSAAVATAGPLFVVRDRYPLPGFGN
jgi:hypothetical protein